MSEFLNINAQDEIINGIPKYNISDNGDGTNNISLANEILQQGTPLNKALLDKIELAGSVMGYNDITGEYNPTTQILELQTDIDTDRFVNNQRLLISPTQNILAPADDLATIKELTTATNTNSGIILTNSRTFDGNLIELHNGNILISGAGGFFVIDNLGNIVQNKTTSIWNNAFYFCSSVELDNGNIMLVGGATYNDSGSAYVVIINQNLQVVKSKTSIGSNMTDPQIYKLRNGDILVAGGYNMTNIIVLDQNGTIKKTETRIINSGNKISNNRPQIEQLSNGKIVISQYCNNGSFASILNEDYTIVANLNDSSSEIQQSKFLVLDDNNIIFIGNKCARIYNSNGEVVKGRTNIQGTTTYYFNNMLGIYNIGNTIVAVGVEYSTNYLLVAFLNSQLTSFTWKYANSNFQYSNSIKMSNGSIIISGSDSTTSRNGRFAIINPTETIKAISVGNYFGTPMPLELSNGNIFALGTNRDGLPYYTIVKPIASGVPTKLNGINIDTTPLKDKYYELVYKESLNKFIAEEVRNAN